MKILLFAIILIMNISASAYTKDSKNACDNGDSAGCYNLGQMYWMGEGVKQDKSQAVMWFTKVAKQGLSSAQFTLGVMYMKGEGVKQDRTLALMWFKKAAKQGDWKAIQALNEGVHVKW